MRTIIENRKVMGLHLDAWFVIAFGVGYFWLQPVLGGYKMVVPW